MTSWSNAKLRVYDELGKQIYFSEDVIDAQNSLVWHEIGRGGSVTVPFFGTNADFIFDRGRRVYVTVTNLDLLTTHIVADFIIENSSIVEESASNNGYITLIKVSGRDLIKELGEKPVRLRHISKYRIGRLPTAIGKTTLQMGAADTADYVSMSLVGWTVELADGNWSEIVAHTAGGLLTIDPAWQVNVDDESAAAPSPQKFYLYGAAFSETTGSYTDLKQVLSVDGAAGKGADWVLYEDGYQSTANGSFVAPGKEASRLKALQLIAAQTGEYFVRVPNARQIQWRREVPALSHPQYGYPLNLVVKDNFNKISEAVILPGAKLTYDVNERVTRIKPTGSGSGDQALTLKDLPVGFPIAAGYTLSGEYLIYNAGESGGGYVAHDLRLDGIGAASDAAGSRQLAATALYNAALLWLREHNDERLVLECEVLSAISIEPVTYVYVTNPDYALANKLMYVLDVTVNYRDNMVLYKLQLSDKKAPVMTEERLLAEAIRQTDVQLFYTNAPARNSRMLDKRGGGTGGGESDHEPVTAGNAAIAVATGQVVSLQLAGPSGLEIASTGLRMADSVAGDGLGISNKVLSINLAPNSGLSLAGDMLGMGTPGTLNALTTSGITGGTHTHAITAASNAKTTPATILKSDTFGDLTLRYLTGDKLISPIVESAGSITLDPANSLIFADGNLSFVGARQINTSSGSLTLAPGGPLIIDPSDNVAQIHTDVTVRTAHAAVGVFPQTGWQVNYSGAGYFTSLLADELHVQSFIADIMRVKVGGEYIPESMGLISRNITIPAVGGTATLYIEDVPGWTDIAAFAAADWVLLRIVDRSGGGLVVASAWGQVTNYADLDGGEQSWTFTTRIATTAVGRIARRGDLALDFGKSGSSWWYVTVLDRAGPHAGFGTWQGNNPTEGISYPIRLGQLHGVSGVNEMGFQAGSGLSSRTRFTNLRNEIHGSRLSLYAGDGAKLQVKLASVIFYRTAGQSSTLLPDSDASSLNATTTTGTFYQAINSGSGQYITNAANLAGYVAVGLSNPATFSSIHHVDLSVTFTATGFSADTARVFGQVFAADEITPLTGELLMLQRSSNVGNQVVSLTLPHDAAATQAQWNGAKLRLRWEYDININQEAIRLDPQVPSIGVGSPLPTGLETGGDGFWVGRDTTGQYKMRLGKPNGQALRWDSADLFIRNAAGDRVIEFTAAGDSRFAGVMTIGTLGGIWQGTGTFAAPTTGLKIWNNSGVGRLATYNGGLEQITINTSGQLTAGEGKTTLDRNGLRLSSGGGAYSSTGSVNFYTADSQFIGYVGATNDVVRIKAEKITGSPTGSTEVDYWRNGNFQVLINREGALEGGNVFTVEPEYSLFTKGVLMKSLGIGDGLFPPPPTAGVIRVAQRADNNTYPDSTQVDIFARTVGGVQKLYAKFGNGTVRELATA